MSSEFSSHSAGGGGTAGAERVVPAGTERVACDGASEGAGGVILPGHPLIYLTFGPEDGSGSDLAVCPYCSRRFRRSGS